ncbi:MAG: acyl-CoA desaturase [Cyclobacteriaceae bacterium]|nr:acyl-CoA desaturase [Cyclobacteriaceae bacterium]
MAEATFNAIKFISKGDKDFGTTVRKRVNDYFKTNKISRLGDYRIWIKVIALPLLYLVSFGLIMTNWYTANLFVFYGLWLLMGIGLAGSGLGIMHDACHGAVSKKRSVNNFIGAMVLNLAGGSSVNWKIQHNVLHHSFTNIDGYDEDIAPAGLMRFSPHQPVKPFYRFQVIYAWFFYGLMTFMWATFKDFVQLSRYNKMGLVKAQGKTYRKELFNLIFLKIIYYTAFIVLPILLLDIAWWHVVLGWFSMHFLAGLILGCVFQPAHVIPSTEFPLPDENNNVEGDWAVHQMMTTANFAPTNRLLSWYVGGLNYQIEHHLFPNMSHVHHRQVSKIVKSTAEEFGVPYYSQPTFIGALVNHAKMLHKLRK